MGLIMLTGANFLLTLSSTVLVVFFAPTAAGPGIPEIKAYLNGIDTPNMYGAPTLFVKVRFLFSMDVIEYAGCPIFPPYSFI